MRRKTKVLKIGSVKIGGDNPVSVQSMTNTDTADVAATLFQIKDLEKAGCEIIRISIPDNESVESLKIIKNKVETPIIADIHFDYRLALKSIEAGVDGLRINPGNIGNKSRVSEVVMAAQKKNIPVRVGVNSGSLEKELLKKYGKVTPEAMVESAMHHIKILEDLGFYDIKISLKASDVIETIDAYKLLAREVDYPFHIGITEAGTISTGAIKSAIGLGILLYEGIGDTIRVSLSGDPVHEVKVGYEILKSLGLRKHGVNIISCPTCSRQEIDVATIAEELEATLTGMKEHLNIAVMGCAVNGPGEAKRCDIGVAGGKEMGVIFKDGKIIKKVNRASVCLEMMKEIKEITKELKKGEE